jgi:predicted Holliday junction resolvase-like endonuclease
MHFAELRLVLLLAAAVFFLIAGFIIGMRLARYRAESAYVEILRQKEAEWGEGEEQRRKLALARSRQIIGGNFSEQLAPYLPDFPFDPTEARFIGKPVDFLVFRGLSQGEIQEVVFVEVKSGGSKMNRNEASLKTAIDEKRVRFIEYRVPQNLTRSEERMD